MNRFCFNSLCALLISLMTIGCGGAEKKQDSAGDAKKETITEKGSDTMILLAQRWAEKFGAKNPNIQVQVTGGGSGTGISALINGTTDICNASRPMKDTEREQVKQKFGRDVVEIPVAKDGIAIYINEANKVDSLTVDQLRDIYLGKVTNWKDVGGADGKVILYGRENSSGTYEFFKEHVLNKQDFATATQTLSGTAAVVNAVGKDANGIGYGGEAYSKGVKVVKLRAGDKPAIAPSAETVLAGTYPLSRYLYLYLRQEPTGSVKQYVDWILGSEGQQTVKEIGYYPIK